MSQAARSLWGRVPPSGGNPSRPGQRPPRLLRQTQFHGLAGRDRKEHRVTPSWELGQHRPRHVASSQPVNLGGRNRVFAVTNLHERRPRSQRGRRCGRSQGSRAGSAFSHLPSRELVVAPAPPPRSTPPGHLPPGRLPRARGWLCPQPGEAACPWMAATLGSHDMRLSRAVKSRHAQSCSQTLAESVPRGSCPLLQPGVGRGGLLPSVHSGRCAQTLPWDGRMAGPGTTRRQGGLGTGFRARRGGGTRHTIGRPPCSRVTRNLRYVSSGVCGPPAGSHSAAAGPAWGGGEAQSPVPRARHWPSDLHAPWTFPGPRLSPDICSRTEAAPRWGQGPSGGCAPGRQEASAPRGPSSRVRLQASPALGAQQKTLQVSVGCLARPHQARVPRCLWDGLSHPPCPHACLGNRAPGTTPTAGSRPRPPPGTA